MYVASSVHVLYYICVCYLLHCVVVTVDTTYHLSIIWSFYIIFVIHSSLFDHCCIGSVCICMITVVWCNRVKGLMWLQGWNIINIIQWNLSILDTIGTAQSVLIKEVSSFQRWECYCLESVLIIEVPLFQSVLLREVPQYMIREVPQYMIREVSLYMIREIWSLPPGCYREVTCLYSDRYNIQVPLYLFRSTISCNFLISLLCKLVFINVLTLNASYC